MKKISFKRAFSLIELMIVIAIIALLTAIITSNLSASKAKSRDGKRISDVAQIQLALELFFDRCNGYPQSISTTDQTIASCPPGVNFGTYITTIPTDGGTSYVYGVNSNSTAVDYILQAHLETPTSALQDDVDGSMNLYVNGSETSINCDDGTTAPYNYCVSPK